MPSIWTLSGGVVLVVMTALITSAVVSTQAGEPQQSDPMEQMQMTEEQKKEMEMWMKLAVPGEHHKHLQPLAGRWDMTTRMRMGPEAPWSESKATSEAEWIMGNRFLVQRVEGEGMGGQPFRGMGIMGYDNGKKKYVAVWVDDHSTMIFVQEGTCSADGKEITLLGSYDDPMAGKKVTGKSVYRVAGPDRYVLEMYKELPGGGEFKTLEIEHVRRS